MFLANYHFLHVYWDIVIVGSVTPQLQKERTIIERLSSQFKKDKELIVKSVTLQLTDGINVTVESLMAQIENTPNYLHKISWIHHIELLNSTKMDEEKVYYLGLTIKEQY